MTDASAKIDVTMIVGRGEAFTDNVIIQTIAIKMHRNTTVVDNAANIIDFDISSFLIIWYFS